MLLPIEPQRNRIFQWLSLKLQGGLSQLSFPLSAEPTLGSYKVVLQKEPGKTIKHSFEVNEYGKNSTHVKDIYDIKECKTGSFLHVGDKQKSGI